MIVFNIRCAHEHVFEAWFADSEAYERQRRRKEIACPVCGDTRAEKAPMAPNVARSRNSAGDLPSDAAQAAEAWKVLTKVRRHVEENFEHVGKRFAEEARKIHYGEADKRDIYGEATAGQAKELREEGVEFQAIPWLPRADN